MGTYRNRLAICFGLILACVASAQTVYESKGGQGKVYSDRPLPGGKPVELRPLNVIEPIPVNASPAPANADTSRQEAPAAAPYRSLSVVFPEAGGSVAANTATFEVRVSIDPPLQVAKGHAFMLRMDGRAVPGRYTSTEMMIPPEFFGDVAPAGVQQHVIEASVVDAQGGSLLAATPVSFQTRFVTELQRPHGMRPVQPLPKPVPKPVPKPSPVSDPMVEVRPATGNHR